MEAPIKQVLDFMKGTDGVTGEDMVCEYTHTNIEYFEDDHWGYKGTIISNEEAYKVAEEAFRSLTEPELTQILADYA